jgi:hypothetical protein
MFPKRAIADVRRDIKKLHNQLTYANASQHCGAGSAKLQAGKNKGDLRSPLLCSQYG